MKKLILSAVVASAIIFGLNSCSKSPAANPNAHFVGTYYGAGTLTPSGGSPIADLDTIVISASPANTSVVVINGYSTQANIMGTVSGNSLTIINQTVSINGATVNISSGSGTLSGNTLTYSYSGSVNGTSFVLNATDSK